MSTGTGPLTFEELSGMYRVEMASSSLVEPRKDLFRAIANFLTSLRKEYEKQMSMDPDSAFTEGIDSQRKRSEWLTKSLISIRTRKIIRMAVLGAEGGRVDMDLLTPEELEYYKSVMELTKNQLAEIDRLRGRIKTVNTRIDAPAQPVAEIVPEPAPAPPDEIPYDESSEEPFDEEPDDFPEEEPVATPKLPDPAPEMVEESPIESELVLVRILEDLPEFAGPERDYKLSHEDLVVIPKMLADALVNTEKAKVVRPRP